MVFADKMNDILAILETDRIVLFPSDTVWMIGTSLLSRNGHKKILDLKSHLSQYPMTVMCSDLVMLKKYLPKIHPRIETLLHYHDKPLTLVEKNWKHIPDFVHQGNRSLSFHISRDIFSQTIIDLLGHPMLVSAVRKTEGSFALKYEDIPFQYLNEADYICKHRRMVEEEALPSVVASYDHFGNLVFHRE